MDNAYVIKYNVLTGTVKRRAYKCKTFIEGIQNFFHGERANLGVNFRFKIETRVNELSQQHETRMVINQRV